MPAAEAKKHLLEQCKKHGAEIIYDKAVEIVKNKFFEIRTEQSGLIDAKAVIIACGSTHKKLGIEREDYFIGKGVSYCAQCDGGFFKNKDTAIAGGGNTALAEAVYLAGICRKVFVIHRRDTFRAEKAVVFAAEGRDNIHFCMNCEVKELIGKDKLEKILLSNGEQLSVSGLFIAVGMNPLTDNFRGFVNMDENGYIVASEDCKTSVEGVFAAGDCRVKTLRQLSTAVSDGAVAAVSAMEYIS